MKKTILLFILLDVFILFLPAVFKKKPHHRVKGPDLSMMHFQEVSFKNSYDSTQLGGMFFLPESPGPCPVAVIIQGSGPSRRDNPWYLAVAAYLQQNGIAVLLPDKRGCEHSGGKWEGADFGLLATDVESAIAFISRQGNFSGTGVLGMSQGGWIAPVVASKMPDLVFVISMSGAMVTFDEQLVFEEFHNIAPYTYDFIARAVAPLTAGKLKKKKELAPFAGFDPIPYWKSVSVPVFIAYGENDTNCPVEESIKRMDEEGLDYYIVKVYPGGGHGILDPETGRVNPLFLSDMKKFIFETMTGKNPG